MPMRGSRMPPSGTLIDAGGPPPGAVRRCAGARRGSAQRRASAAGAPADRARRHLARARVRSRRPRRTSRSSRRATRRSPPRRAPSCGRWRRQPGSDPDDLKVIVPVLPVVAETDAAARAIVDRLLLLVPIDDGVSPTPARGVPREPLARRRSSTSPASSRATACAAASVDDAVDAVDRRPVRRARVAHARDRCEARTGRDLGGEHPVTWRHLDRRPCGARGLRRRRTRGGSPTTSNSGATREPPTASTCSRRSSRRSSRPSPASPCRSCAAVGSSAATGATLRERLGSGSRGSSTSRARAGRRAETGRSGRPRLLRGRAVCRRHDSRITPCERL